MFAAFRRLSKSAFGTVIMVLFLLAILASFAIADIGSVSSGGLGLNRGTLVKIGSEAVDDREMDSAMQRALTDAQQQNPEATYASIADQFGTILDQLINQATLFAFASDHGFVLSKRLIDAEIAEIPSTRGLDGKFNEQAYAAFLQQQRLTDAQVRRLIGASLLQRLIIAPAAVDAKVPLGMARTYASMLLEQREGQMVVVPADAFRAGLNPSPGDLQSFYAQNRQRYIVPEQRILKIATMGPETLSGVSPTEAEIAAYYKANQAAYAGSETRVLSQAVVADKRQADGIAARAKSGPFAAAAAPAGLAAEDVNLGAQTRAQFVGVANDALASAVFSAARGAVIGPVRSDLGWHVVKVEDIRGASGRTLAQAREEIAALLTTNKRKEAMADLVARVEDQIADGSSFAEAVAAAKLPVVTTPAVNSAGAARADATYRLPAVLQPVLKAGFAMSADDDPEVITLPNDAGYALVAVERVVEAAPAPFAEITDRLRADWIQRKANERARGVATDISNKVARGVPIEQALAEAKSALPPVEPISARRLQIAQASADAAPALRMLFSLAEGKSRLVADPRGRGYFIVKTNKITPGNALGSPALITRTQIEFQQAVGGELAQQTLAAMRADQGVTRNEEAIATAKQRITGAGQ